MKTCLRLPPATLLALTLAAFPGLAQTTAPAATDAASADATDGADAAEDAADDAADDAAEGAGPERAPAPIPPPDGAEDDSPNSTSSDDDADGAQEGAGAQRDGPGIVEASLDYTREPVDRLAEHYLGSTSRAVRFDWRKSWVTFGITGSELLERNNFGSFKIGGLVRRAFLGFMIEGAVSYVYVVGTQSSELLGLTPYRQPSRPSRVEIDVNLSYPLFEGVVTPLFDFIPPSEIVVSATGAGRYLFYPGILIGERRWQTPSTWTNTATWQAVAQSLGTAQMLEADKTLLEEDALNGMTVDPALVHTLGGITLDAYYQPGLFFGARALLNIPALQLVTGTQLGFWWELSVRAGWAF